MRLSNTMSGWPEGFNMHNHRCNRWEMQIAQLTLQCNQHAEGGISKQRSRNSVIIPVWLATTCSHRYSHSTLRVRS